MKNKLLDKNAPQLKKLNGWTKERRKRQAELIHQWQPWKNSTGAITVKGKTKVSQNSYKGGYWKELRKLQKQTNGMLKRQSELINKL